MNYGPTIVAIITYVQIFYLLELIFMKSRIQTSTNIRKTEKFCTKKLVGTAVKFVFRILLGVYLVMQAAFCILLIFYPNNKYIMKVFHIQILIFNILFILDVNISMLVVYCSHAG